jgi:BRCA1-associated protein
MDGSTTIESSKYTIVFDLFSHTDLLNFETDSTNLLNIYLESLVNKRVFTSDTIFNQSDWIENIWKEKDIFVEKDFLKPNHKVVLDNWANKFQSVKNKTFKKSIDYRFSAIQITPIDINSKFTNLMSFSHKTTNKSSSNSIINDKLCAELLGIGVIRLFKDSENHINLSKIDTDGLKHVPGDQTTVAILSVPFYFSASDLLIGFFDEDDTKKLSHIRLIKSSAPNRFMILLKFREKNDVKPFLRKYQGRKFNSFEPETCSIIEVKEIIFRPKSKDRIENLKIALPYLLEDPFTNDSDDENFKSDKQLPRKYTELATCPVCLDRLDSNVSGLFTIPCQHTFHSSCLSKWKDDSCPVCRYSNKPTINNNYERIESDVLNSSGLDNNEICSSCGLNKNLWICLICGNVGCGRYDNQHAIHHWENTGHCFAMETNTQRVWDYSQDGYVHRLVQNEADGKIVELPLRDGSKKSTEEKVDKIGFEYSKLLIGQLESQREYYEEKIEGLQKQITFYKDSTQQVHKQFEALQSQFDSMRSQFEINNSKNDEVIDKHKKLTSLNGALIEQLKMFKIENGNLKSKNTELQEQVTDLMFFLDSQDKFKDASDDVKEGTIVIGSSST